MVAGDGPPRRGTGRGARDPAAPDGDASATARAGREYGSELAEARGRIARLEGELEELRSAAAETERRLEAELSQERRARGRWQAQATRNAEELQKLQGHLTTLLNGRLFRIVRPLRRWRHRLRRSR